MNSTIHHLVSTSTAGGFECRTSTDWLSVLSAFPAHGATASFISLTTPTSQVLLIWGTGHCKPLTHTLLPSSSQWPKCTVTTFQSQMTIIRLGMKNLHKQKKIKDKTTHTWRAEMLHPATDRGHFIFCEIWHFHGNADEDACLLKHNTLSVGIYWGADKSLPDQEGNKLQRQKILMFIYPIYNHNWRNISTTYTCNKTSIKRNILTIKQNTSGSKSG